MYITYTKLKVVTKNYSQVSANGHLFTMATFFCP